MLKQKFLKINENPISAAVLYLLIWALLTCAFYLLSEFVIVNAFAFMLFFMMLYPICTLVINFMYAKRNGIRFYMPAVQIVLVVAAYIFVKDFNAITPNIIVSTILCLLFGQGLGNCFADKYAIEAEKEERRRKKLHEDEKYKKILDD